MFGQPEPGTTGIPGRLTKRQFKKHLRDIIQQSGLQQSDILEAVNLGSDEEDDEQGGVRLDGASFGPNPDHSEVKGSNLNPSSSPWVPKTATTYPSIINEEPTEIYELESLPAKNAHLASNNNGGCSIHQTGHDFAQVSTHSFPSTMRASQQLTGSISMGSLGHETPVRQGNGIMYNYGSNGAAIRADLGSPDSDTIAKAANTGCLMTEPRNFAPRSSIMAHLGAPPKFNLNSAGIDTTSAGRQDSFAAPTRQGSPVQVPVPASQIDPSYQRATGQTPFGSPSRETLNLDDVSHEGHHSVTNDLDHVGSREHQAMAFRSLHCSIQATVNSASAALATHQAAISPPSGYNTALVPYQTDIYSTQAATTNYNAVPDYIRAQRSPELNRLTANCTGRPTVNVALSQANFPFVEPATRPRNGLIPFMTNRAEIIAVLGRNSRILNDTEEPVHIIMERVTGKTTDAYVEFHTLEDASKAVEKHHQNLGRGRVTRIGQRPVDIELSSQSALMKDLFPSARGVLWNGGNPEILPPKNDEPWDNFKSFVSNEEMTMLVKHVEVPHRSPFSKDCPQRPFECLISTLTKFPWHMKANVTVQQRNAIHKATCDLIRILVGGIRDKRDELNLTPRLLKRVVAAAMRCEGFSVVQKDDIAYLVEMGEMEQRAYGQPRFAESWRHLYVLVPKNGVPLDVIEWYIAVVREETNAFLELQSFQEKCQTRSLGDATDAYFGFFWRELNHPVGLQFDSMTLSQLAMHEYQTLETIIRRALTSVAVH
ncbi:hypothetical protein CCHL11_05225 [Colletotrichum chlorophyti]|uniref:RRM domain-containing protein n=1 Tax=Colletotrichum chlorophyti TaxID=708187 RepID=A0A1Q8RP44_9PEZI|nr:hypothetical protein CCHL11_05225 [Colletotrichum chlorophyti]